MSSNRSTLNPIASRFSFASYHSAHSMTPPIGRGSGPHSAMQATFHMPISPVECPPQTTHQTPTNPPQDCPPSRAILPPTTNQTTKTQNQKGPPPTGVRTTFLPPSKTISKPIRREFRHESPTFPTRNRMKPDRPQTKIGADSDPKGSPKGADTDPKRVRPQGSSSSNSSSRPAQIAPFQAPFRTPICVEISAPFPTKPPIFGPKRA